MYNPTVSIHYIFALTMRWSRIVKTWQRNTGSGVV